MNPPREGIKRLNSLVSGIGKEISPSLLQAITSPPPLPHFPLHAPKHRPSRISRRIDFVPLFVTLTTVGNNVIPTINIYRPSFLEWQTLYFLSLLTQTHTFLVRASPLQKPGGYRLHNSSSLPIFQGFVLKLLINVCCLWTDVCIYHPLWLAYFINRLIQRMTLSLVLYSQAFMICLLSESCLYNKINRKANKEVL